MSCRTNGPSDYRTLPVYIIKMNKHISSQSIEYKKTTVYDVGHSSPGLRQAHKCDGVKTVNWIPTPS